MNPEPSRVCELCGFDKQVEYFELVGAHLCPACADLPGPSVRVALEEARRQAHPPAPPSAPSHPPASRRGCGDGLDPLTKLPAAPGD